MKSEIKAIKAVGEKAEGQILFLGEEVRPFSLDKRIAGKIVAGGKFGKTALTKIQVLGAVGVVTQEISDEVFEEISKGCHWEIGESCHLVFPLLVIEKSDLEILEKNQGEKAILDPEEKRLILCP